MTNPATIERLRPTTVTDRYGNTVADDWTTPDVQAITGAVWAPVTNSENNELGRQGVVIGWRFYLTDVDVDIEPTDRVRWNGDDYEVEGEPARYAHPITGRRVVEILVSRVEG